VYKTQFSSTDDWSSVYYVAATDYTEYLILVGCPEITEAKREYRACDF